MSFSFHVVMLARRSPLLSPDGADAVTAPTLGAALESARQFEGETAATFGAALSLLVGERTDPFVFYASLPGAPIAKDFTSFFSSVWSPFLRTTTNHALANAWRISSLLRLGDDVRTPLVEEVAQRAANWDAPAITLAFGGSSLPRRSPKRTRRSTASSQLPPHFWPRSATPRRRRSSATSPPTRWPVIVRMSRCERPPSTHTHTFAHSTNPRAPHSTAGKASDIDSIVDDICKVVEEARSKVSHSIVVEGECHVCRRASTGSP